MDGGTNPKTWVIISVLFVGIHCTIAAGGTIYVDETKNGDGSSWANAYKYLQDALRSAQSGDEIRVAEGVYKPDEDTAHPNGSGSRYETFRLKNGVTIKGGYAGYGEPDPDARHFELYETILSGDLNGDDGPDFANNGENSYHVVTGSWINATAVLDGFTITAGNAGSGVGGGMVNFGGSSPTLNNCTFSDNSAGEGGGMHNRTGSSPTVTNCIFSGNSADWGGGMTNWDYSSPTLTNCTFTGNSASEDGGGMSNDNSSPTIANCILWGNTAPSGSQIHNDGTSSATVSYSDVQGGWAGAGNIAADPRFLDVSNGDLRLLPDSPCIDAGDNTAVPAGVTTDLGGNPRFVDDPYTVDTGNGTPPIVDMGAYEYRLPIQGQIAHWKFDEGGGTTAYDSAGENHGTLMNGPQWTTGQIDGALRFDGDDDYVELGTIDGTDDLALAGSNFTICSWIKPNLTGDTFQRIVDKSNEGSGANGYGFFVIPDGKIGITVAGNDFASEGGIITAGIWQHVAVTGDGSDYQFYVDGLPVSGSFYGGSYNSPPSVSTNMRIGTWNHSTAREFNGSIDDVRIYNQALSAEEVEQLYQDGLGGLVGLWKFDEGGGTTAYDSAGENHGTIYGAQWTTGKVDGALMFDGVDDYVEITGYKGISGTSARTCAAWIKTDTNGQIISWGEETVGRKWTFRVDFNGTVRAEVAGGGINSSTAVADGAWHHVAVVWENDGSPYICDAMLYVDGQQETTSCPGDKEMNTASYANVRIGKAFIANRNFDGTIDDVRIYDRALSAEEVEQLYQDGLAELVSLEIVGPNEVAENFETQYKAIAHYDNSGTRDVTASADWAVEPNDIADIDAGLLETEEIYESGDITIYAQYTEGEVTVEAEKPVSIFAICPSGSALSFDGVDDYVDCGNDPSLEVGDDSLTIATWVKTPDENQRAPISYKRQPVPPYEQYSLGIGGDDPWSPLSVGKKFQLNYIESPGNYRGAVTDNEYVDGDWHHVVAIADKVKEEIIFYVDGIRVDSTLVRDSGSWPTVNNTDPLYIGYNAGDRYFNGVIDDVRIYNQALSAEEIQASMHTKLAGDEDGLVAYWDFDEGDGEIASDSSGNGNDGTIVGAEWVQSDAPIGICTPVVVDIKPGSCPNPLNLASRGVLPAAILGTEEFDVTTIDAGSIFLEGVPTIRTSYEDVTAPVSDGNECDCTEAGPDGFTDLTLKFGTQEIVEELINWPGELAEGQTLALELRGELTDGRIIASSDCVVLVGNVPKWLAARRWDANGDGLINMTDFAVFAENWLVGVE